MALKKNLKSKGAKALPSKLTVDFGGVTEGGGGRSSHMAEGDHLFKVIKAVRKRKAGADTEYVSWQLKAVKGPSRGTIFHITSLKPEQLWSFRNFLQDLTGKEIPTKSLNLDLENFAGKFIGGTVADDEPWEGKEKSKLDAHFPASEYSEDEEETKPEKAAKKVEKSDTKKSKKSKDEDEDEEEEDEDEEESDDDEEESDDDEDEDELEVDDL